MNWQAYCAVKIECNSVSEPVRLIKNIICIIAVRPDKLSTISVGIKLICHHVAVGHGLHEQAASSVVRIPIISSLIDGPCLGFVFVVFGLTLLG